MNVSKICVRALSFAAAAALISGCTAGGDNQAPNGIAGGSSLSFMPRRVSTSRALIYAATPRDLIYILDYATGGLDAKFRVPSPRTCVVST
jgi:hypothetical protein